MEVLERSNSLQNVFGSVAAGDADLLQEPAEDEMDKPLLYRLVKVAEDGTYRSATEDDVAYLEAYFQHSFLSSTERKAYDHTDRVEDTEEEGDELPRGYFSGRGDVKASRGADDDAPWSDIEDPESERARLKAKMELELEEEQQEQEQEESAGAAHHSGRGASIVQKRSDRWQQYKVDRSARVRSRPRPRPAEHPIAGAAARDHVAGGSQLRAGAAAGAGRRSAQHGQQRRAPAPALLPPPASSGPASFPASGAAAAAAAGHRRSGPDRRVARSHSHLHTGAVRRGLLPEGRGVRRPAQQQHLNESLPPVSLPHDGDPSKTPIRSRRMSAAGGSAPQPGEASAMASWGRQARATSRLAPPREEGGLPPAAPKSVVLFPSEPSSGATLHSEDRGGSHPNAPGVSVQDAPGVGTQGLPGAGAERDAHGLFEVERHHQQRLRLALSLREDKHDKDEVEDDKDELVDMAENDGTPSLPVGLSIGSGVESLKDEDERAGVSCDAHPPVPAGLAVGPPADTQEVEAVGGKGGAERGVGGEALGRGALDKSVQKRRRKPNPRYLAGAEGADFGPEFDTDAEADDVDMAEPLYEEAEDDGRGFLAPSLRLPGGRLAEGQERGDKLGQETAGATREGEDRAVKAGLRLGSSRRPGVGAPGTRGRPGHEGSMPTSPRRPGGTILVVVQKRKAADGGQAPFDGQPAKKRVRRASRDQLSSVRRTRVALSGPSPLGHLAGSDAGGGENGGGAGDRSLGDGAAAATPMTAAIDPADERVPTASGGMRRKHHRPWTLREVMTLVEGVARCGGGKWADIKKLAFASIGYRTAVDLKDKWRNLLRASRTAGAHPNKLAGGSRKHQMAASIPAPVLARVRELAAQQQQAQQVHDNSASSGGAASPLRAAAAAGRQPQRR
eukprot:jgi/Mesen1/6992/ME000365S06130